MQTDEKEKSLPFFLETHFTDFKSVQTNSQRPRRRDDFFAALIKFVHPVFHSNTELTQLKITIEN